MTASHLRSVQRVIALAAVVLLCSCRSERPAAAVVLTVPVATAEPATLVNDLVLTAEFRPYQDVEVMAKVAGYVKAIPVDIGDHVKTGDLLATLEVPEVQDEVAKAKALVASAEAAATVAQLSYQRLVDVARRDQGLVPLQDIDLAQSRNLGAAAQLASAQSALASAQAMMEYATIRAPFSGVITHRYASVGSMIQAGVSSQTQAMPVVRLAQNDLLRLVLPVPVSAAGAVKDGEAVDVTVPSLGLTRTYPLTRFAESVQMATRTMDAEVDVPNPDRTFLPGMYAEVRLHLAARPGVLSVPLDAVDGLGTSVKQVYVVRDGVLHVTDVATGLQTPTRVEILSGLHRGDQVVVGRHSGLSDGDKVDPRPAAYEANGTHR